ncbi:hypothetical protein NDU88_004880 [Pleurodeles waltl]|uniref:Uncharacterized protein n=1 Tax=Pleurodeles waltl TaxID=8319 RepID=A0AAV7UIA9_PLEWA|nr:hypothetical protein NDU88_004880 [Pleurodeles waltl]
MVASGVRARMPNDMPAVSFGSQMGACGNSECAFKSTCAHRKAFRQAPLALESSGEHRDVFQEESTLGWAAKMAAPLGDIVLGSVGANSANFAIRQGGGENFLDQEIIILDSEEELEIEEVEGLVTEEEELDYEDEVPVLGVWAAAAQKATSGWAVQGDRLSCRRELSGNLRRVAEIPWAGTGSGCAEDGGSQGVMGIRRVRMLEMVQQSIAPSTRRSYEQAWLEFLKSGAVVSGDPMEAVPYGYLGTLSCGGRRSKRHPGILERNWV